MATAADSASSNHSSGLSADGLNSPHQYRRRNLPSPWARVVRGGESEAVPVASSSPLSSPLTATVASDQTTHLDSFTAKSSPDNSGVEVQSDNSDNINKNNNSNAATTKKPAWSKPSNGAVEVGPVMGAVSWPALSESTRASPKSSSESLKGLADGSTTILQGPAIASPLQNQSTDNANPNSTPNHAFSRQKSMKRGGGGGGSVIGGFTQPPPPPPPQPVEMPQNNSSKPAPVIPGSSPREPHHKSSSNWETGPKGGSGSQAHAGSDHPQQRSSFRRGGNGGHYPRGDGPYHNNNFGGRRDQDRGNYEWNSHRSFNGRDVHMQQQRIVPRAAFVRPPSPSSAPFISPPPVRPFGNPMGFPDITSPVYYVPAPHPDSLRGVPFIAHTPAPTIYFPAPDPQLRDMLVKQIEYYFSSENLCKDIFLRQNMDEQGWVPVSLIAGFNRVKLLTNNIPFILDVVRSSTVVEIQGDKIRKRNDWMSWPLPPSS